MSVDLSEILVVGVTARALFNLEAENDIFEKEGVRKYREYQDKNQDVPLEIGTAFYLVKSLLELNKQAFTMKASIGAIFVSSVLASKAPLALTI